MTRIVAALVVWALVLASAVVAGEPGSFAIVSRNGTVVYARAAGSADIENDVPITKQTVFRIASLTKPFTAVAI